MASIPAKISEKLDRFREFNHRREHAINTPKTGGRLARGLKDRVVSVSRTVKNALEHLRIDPVAAQARAARHNMEAAASTKNILSLPTEVSVKILSHIDQPITLSLQLSSRVGNSRSPIHNNSEYLPISPHFMSLFKDPSEESNTLSPWVITTLPLVCRRFNDLVKFVTGPVPLHNSTEAKRVFLSKILKGCEAHFQSPHNLKSFVEFRPEFVPHLSKIRIFYTFDRSIDENLDIQVRDQILKNSTRFPSFERLDFMVKIDKPQSAILQDRRFAGIDLSKTFTYCSLVKREAEVEGYEQWCTLNARGHEVLILPPNRVGVNVVRRLT